MRVIGPAGSNNGVEFCLFGPNLFNFGTVLAKAPYPETDTQSSTNNDVLLTVKLAGTITPASDLIVFCKVIIYCNLGILLIIFAFILAMRQSLQVVKCRVAEQSLLSHACPPVY